ncbi:MAG: gfo/Idh/MocA family oxidoreductase, partial [Calditrichaeota bacterium]
MKISLSINRRHFIQQMGLLTGVAAVPNILSAQSSSKTQADPANDRLNAVVVGLGKQGSGLLYGFLRSSGVQVIAVCDVDREKLVRAQSQVNDYYAQKSGRSYKGCRAVVDYREIISSDEVDIVVFATPDHWHVQQSIEAARAGKDIYCEKPLTLTIAEARSLVNEIRRNERILQTGSMQRSMGHFRFACELVRNGYIGDVKKVRVSIRTGFISHPIICDLAAEKVPAELDWDLWLGPAPERPYNAILAPPIAFDGFPAWRDYRDYSGG